MLTLGFCLLATRAAELFGKGVADAQPNDRIAALLSCGLYVAGAIGTARALGWW